MTAVQVNSRDNQCIERRLTGGEYQPKDDGPTEYARAGIALLEESVVPLPAYRLAKMCGYRKGTANNGIEQWLMCMTFIDTRVYEEDDGRIGLVGVHLDDGGAPLADELVYRLTAPRTLASSEMIRDAYHYLKAGMNCTNIAERFGVGYRVIQSVQRRAKQEGLL